VTVTAVTVTAMTTVTMTAVTMTAVTMTAVTMTGKRPHGKQHGSRYRANERELAKHEFLRGQSAILYPRIQCCCPAPVPLTNDDPEASTFPVVSDNETVPPTMDR
jgi:hypothetical protein